MYAYLWPRENTTEDRGISSMQDTSACEVEYIR